jgi:hypothetical protein
MILSIRRTPRGAARFVSHLFEMDRYSADCSRHFSADLWAAELQDHAIGILVAAEDLTTDIGTLDKDTAGPGSLASSAALIVSRHALR